MDNIDVGLAYWLSEKRPGERLDIPVSGPIQVREQGVRIFYSPACQYCMFWNERIRKFVGKVKPNARVNEVNLLTQPEEAIQRKVTSPVTYVNGKPIPPMDSEQFYENIKTLLQG
jgi:glutaredoxin